MVYQSKSVPRVNSSVPLTHQDPGDLGLIRLVKKCIIRFGILSDLKSILVLSLSLCCVDAIASKPLPGIHRAPFGKVQSSQLWYDESGPNPMSLQ